ncbi:phage tail tube protein [Niveispirillum sp.]|uniref:phage tail tube protein n=1 Tax=Niveispirillum sp. TaxID=1917217 RepID=UPI001B4E3AE6|nr:phage tail tube protein [Niveispirillum sp.]MBP7339093.1 hypothetical protein [Niveispirillum sp.]
MTDSNRLRLTGVRQNTFGVTPNTPRMRTMRVTGEGLSYKPVFETPGDIRPDRMNADPIKVGETSNGPINYELHYPVPSSILAENIASAFQADWVDTPTRDNDGTADSVITDIGTTANTIAFTTGASYVVGHLVRTSGFATAGNNSLFPVTTGGATSLVSSGASFTAEAAPPAAARVKVVGFQGTSGDITAAAGGLASTTLNFTTLGLSPGQWIKIGGTGAAFRYATEALNTLVRVTGVAANLLSLDNLPSGWTTDAGTGKTIRVFFGDRIKNGTASIALTFERGFMGQGTPGYVVNETMQVNQWQQQVQSRQKVTGSFDYVGLTGSVSTTSLDSVPDDAPSIAAYPIMAAGANVGRIAENGVALTSPNWVKSASFTVNNNLRTKEAADSVASVDIGSGEAAMTVSLETYFGSTTLYAKMLAGTATNASYRVIKGNQAMVFAWPRLTITDGSPNASGKNQDVMLPLTLQASYDSLTGAQMTLDRFEYYEA